MDTSDLANRMRLLETQTRRLNRFTCLLVLALAATLVTCFLVLTPAAWLVLGQATEQEPTATKKDEVRYTRSISLPLDLYLTLGSVAFHNGVLQQLTVECELRNNNNFDIGVDTGYLRRALLNGLRFWPIDDEKVLRVGPPGIVTLPGYRPTVLGYRQSRTVRTTFEFGKSAYTLWEYFPTDRAREETRIDRIPAGKYAVNLACRLSIEVAGRPHFVRMWSENMKWITVPEQ